jgi:hydrogenase expression/formation protein HypD
MKYIDEFRDKAIVRKLSQGIEKLSRRSLNLMELCGTHTTAIFRSGIKQLLPGNINLISGPGCPVCVTSVSDINRMLALARIKNTVIATFGDMLKVPGTESSLEKERSAGADIRAVYSPADALEIARKNRSKEVVFLAVGFETTSPAVASVVHDGRAGKINNFSVYCCHKSIPPAIAALLCAREIKIDGFLLPGHVSSVIGAAPYSFISEKFKIPCVISGFEAADILETILMLLKQISLDSAKVEIQYKRAVRPQGNIAAQEMIKRVFTPARADWRGLGVIPKSGLKLNSGYKDFDAEARFEIKAVKPLPAKNCLCPEVLRGVKNPGECKLFAKTCNPGNPFGPCMVSSEGTCAAWYKYNR